MYSIFIFNSCFHTLHCLSLLVNGNAICTLERKITLSLSSLLFNILEEHISALLMDIKDAKCQICIYNSINNFDNFQIDVKTVLSLNKRFFPVDINAYECLNLGV